MKHFLTITLAVLAIVADVVAVDYNPDLACPINILHISCENLALFDQPGVARILISDDYKSNIVFKHNTYRNNAASGVDPLRPACRMETMEWDKELEDLAMLNLLTCNSKHEHCPKMPVYPNAGQNVGSLMATSKAKHKDIIDTIILQWFDEAKYEMIQIYEGEVTPQSEFPNFATMVMDKNNRVGCALAGLAFDDTMIDYLLSCNYAHAPTNYAAVYASCKSAGEKCESPKNRDFPNLCSENETYII